MELFYHLGGAVKNLFQLVVGVGVLFDIERPHAQQFRQGLVYQHHTIPHIVGAWVDAQNDSVGQRFCRFWHGHTISFSTVENPNTFSPNIFLICESCSARNWCRQLRMSSAELATNCTE